MIDGGSRSLIVAYPDESAFDALTKMLMNNVGRLPVVDRQNPEKMIGYINRAAVMACWGNLLHKRRGARRDGCKGYEGTGCGGPCGARSKVTSSASVRAI